MDPFAQAPSDMSEEEGVGPLDVENLPITDMEEDAEQVFFMTASGTFQLRTSYMGDIPLRPLPGDATGETGDLGQQFWGHQWFRLHAEVGVRPTARIVGEIDLFDGLVFGDFTQGVEAAEHAREDATAFPGVQPRALYLEWLSSVGVLRGGLMPCHWGLGILANDGAHEPVFGDYRYGNIVTRASFTTTPLGRSKPFYVTLAADWVFDDLTADVRDDQDALQAVVSAYYQATEDRALGLYLVGRRQRNEVTGEAGAFEDERDVFVADVFAQWDTAEPSGGRLFGAVEAAYVHGKAATVGTAARTQHDVRQWLVAAQVGRRDESVDVVFELGYTSGDSDATDGAERRGVIHPDHRVGLLMFPEVMAWQTARAATLAQSEALEDRAVPGSSLQPTNGGVSGAAYLFPHAIWRISSQLQARFGAVWARATTDVVDPYAQRVRSQDASYTGGDPKSRDLGLELDGSLLMRGEIARGVELSGGVEGGVFLPGHAFDDERGETMDPVGMIRGRVGLRF